MTHPNDSARDVAADRHGTLSCYHLRRCRCQQCRAACMRYEKQRTLDALRGKPRTVPAIGSLRRVQALAVLGYPLRIVAAELGLTVGRLHRSVNGKRIGAGEAARIARVYERLRHRDPARCGVDAAQTGRVSRMARGKGWAGPDAWELAPIDDPSAEADEPGPYRPARSYEEITEDALFVLATAGPVGRDVLAARLGVRVRRLDRALAAAREQVAA